jgi:3-keto-5-aminohexanoate cleavage enzyme
MCVVPSTLTRVVDLLPEHSVWAATGVGKYQFEVNCWAVAMGGHVRVGLEDSLWMDKGVKASNVAQVERIVAVGKSMGREPATAEEARGLIWQQ